jgi:hypothetical protein
MGVEEMKRQPTPLNDRFNKMPKYRGLNPGIRRSADDPTRHGTVKVVYSRDFPQTEGSWLCPSCHRWANASDARCPWCGKTPPP